MPYLKVGEGWFYTPSYMARIFMAPTINYGERAASLRTLGFNSYQAYLDSPLWENIRHRVIASTKGVCAVCGKGACQVHHTSYCVEAMAGRANKLLVPLCGTCHLKIEFNNKGGKRPPEMVAFKLKGLIERCRAMREQNSKKKRKNSGYWTGMYHKHKWLRRKGLE